MFGGVLDIEDRVVTSKRFITGREMDDAPAPCELEEAGLIGPASPFARQTLPSAYVHATAINNLLLRDSLSLPPRPIGRDVLHRPATRTLPAM